MLKVLKILVTAHALVGGAAMLSACGQKGPLFLPSSPESAGRATLPETLKGWPGKTAPPDASVPSGPTTPQPSPANGPLNTPTSPKLSKP